MKIIPKKKRKNKEKHFLLEHWPILIAAMFLAGMFMFMRLIQNAIITGTSAVLFSLVSVTLPSIVTTCIFVPAIFLIITWKIINRKRLGLITTLSDIGAIGLMVIGGFIACLFITFTAVYYPTGLKDTLEHNDQVFVLTSKNTYDDLGYGRFTLYQCDRWGFICSEVYETGWGIDTSFPSELEYDPELFIISVVINGNTVHSYKIQ